MSQLLLKKNNTEYVLHEYNNEKQLEEMVKDHYKKIFGEQAIFFDKQKIQTKAEIQQLAEKLGVKLEY